jgi:hypothetical protein
MTASIVLIVKVMTLSSEMSVDNSSRLYIRYETSFLIVFSKSLKSLPRSIVVLFLCKAKRFGDVKCRPGELAAVFKAHTPGA